MTGEKIDRALVETRFLFFIIIFFLFRYLFFYAVFVIVPIDKTDDNQNVHNENVEQRFIETVLI